MEAQMLFFTYTNLKWTYKVLPSPEQPNLLEKPRIRKKPVFCNMSAVVQENNSRYNQVVDEATNICSDNGAINGWSVFANFLYILASINSIPI